MRHINLFSKRKATTPLRLIIVNIPTIELQAPE